VAFTLNELATLAYKRGDFEGAETLAKGVYERTSKLTMEYLKSPALAFQGRIKLAQGRLKEARKLMLESLNMAWSTKTRVPVTYVLVCLSEFSLATGQVKQAVMWLTFLYHYPSMEQRDEAFQVLEKAKAQLSPQEFAQAQEESKSLTLETIVTGILEQETK
jgi:ATP/maltotriose-dependent transcriptional regulator MalT